jgi:hypothetical protein
VQYSSSKGLVTYFSVSVSTGFLEFAVNVEISGLDTFFEMYITRGR